MCDCVQCQLKILHGNILHIIITMSLVYYIRICLVYHKYEREIDFEKKRPREKERERDS